MANLEGIKFNRFNQYVHGYYVDGLHDRLLKFKENIVKDYWDDKEELDKNNTYNAPLRNVELRDNLRHLCFNIVRFYYNVDEGWDNSNFGIYVQTKDSYTNIFHSHYISSTITCTFYIDPPSLEEGGALELMMDDAKVLSFQPKENYIYLFPAWVSHRPTPHKSEIERVCFNWGYDCLQRPVHKLVGDRW